MPNTSPRKIREVNAPGLPRGRGAPKLGDEPRELLGAQVGDGEKIQPGVRPSDGAEALACGRARRKRAGPRSPHEKVDRVFAAVKHEGGGGAAVQVFEPAAGQWKTGGGEIDDGRREIELAGEPRFHGVPVGRGDVGEVVRLERAHVVGDRFGEERARARAGLAPRVAGEQREGEGGGEAGELPEGKNDFRPRGRRRDGGGVFGAKGSADRFREGGRCGEARERSAQRGAARAGVFGEAGAGGARAERNAATFVIRASGVRE